MNGEFGAVFSRIPLFFSPILHLLPFTPHSRCTENSMVDLSERPGANPQGMPKFWQQKILYRNQKANLSKPHGSTNLLFSKKSPLSGPMYHQISKRRSVSQEQNALLKSQNPGNVGNKRNSCTFLQNQPDPGNDHDSAYRYEDQQQNLFQGSLEIFLRH